MGPAFWQHLFSVVLYASSGCVCGFLRGFLCQLIARLVRVRAGFLFPTFSSYNINSELFQTARSVHNHRVCLQTPRFGIPCFQCFEFVGFAHCHVSRFLLCLLYDHRCLTLVYTGWLSSRSGGGEGGGRSVGLMFGDPLLPPSPPDPSSTNTAPLTPTQFTNLALLQILQTDTRIRWTFSTRRFVRFRPRPCLTEKAMKYGVSAVFFYVYYMMIDV